MAKKQTFTQRLMKGWYSTANQLSKFILGPPRNETAGHIEVSSPRTDFANAGQPNSYEDWIVEAFEANEVICGALNLIANTFNEAELKVLDDEDNHLDMSITQQLFNHMSEETTQRQFFTRAIFYLYLGGACFIEKARDSRGRVTALYLIRPDRMRIHTTPEAGITHYTFELGSVNKRMDPKDVIFIPFVSPRSPYQGYSPIWSLIKTINSDNAAKAHSEELLANRGRPGSLITTENEMDSEEAYSMARSWDRAFKGAKNGSTGILWSGAQYQQLGMSMKDMDFSALRKVDESKILSTLRIPLSVYGSITGSEASTFNNVKESKRQFWEQCILPLQNLIKDALNNDKELTVEGRVVFDTSSILALQEDMNAVAERCVKIYEGGILTLNEVRAKLGYDELEGGDEVRNMNPEPPPMEEDEKERSEKKEIEIEEATYEEPKEVVKKEEEEEVDISLMKELNSISSEFGAGVGDIKSLYRVKNSTDLLEPIEGPEAASSNSINHNINVFMSYGFSQEMAVKKANEIADQSYQLPTNGVLKKGQELLAKDYEVKTTDDDLKKQLEIALGREALANEFLNATEKLINKHLKAQIQDVLLLAGTKEHKAQKQFETNRLNDGIDKLAAEWEVNLEADSLDVIGYLTEKSAKASALSVGKEIDFGSQDALDSIRANTFKFAKKVTETSVIDIKKVIATSYDEGKTLGETSKALQDLNKQWTKGRVNTIARTETFRAANEGARIGYARSGVVTKLQYSAILDGKTSEICQHLNGKIVGIDEKFLTEQEGFVGSDGKAVNLSYDQGVPNPPAHPNCRCTIIPVIEEL